MSARAAEVIHHKPDALFVQTDEGGVITYASDAFVKVSGYVRADLIGMHSRQLFPPDVPVWVTDAMAGTLRGGHPWRGCLPCLSRDGAACFFRVTVAPLMRAGRATGCLWLFQRPDEAEIAQASANYRLSAPPARPRSMSRWFADIGLQVKLQILIQPVLFALLALSTFFVYSQMRQTMLENAERRAEETAMQVIDSANMLMVTGQISIPENRSLMIHKIIEGQHLMSLKLLRTEQVVRQFGAGLPEERLDDPVVAQAIANSVAAGKPKPYFSLQFAGSQPVFRAVTPYIESHDFHGTDCLLCHEVAVGSSNGASDMSIDLSDDFAHLNTTVGSLITGQVLLQIVLFFFIDWVSRRFVHAPVEEVKRHLNEIVNGEFSRPLDISGRDEMGELFSSVQSTKILMGSAVNQIEEKLSDTLLEKSLLERQSNVLENIILAHEKVSQWKDFVQDILSGFHSIFSFNIFFVAFAEEHGLSLFVYYMGSYSDEAKLLTRTRLARNMLAGLGLPPDAALDIEEFDVQESETIMQAEDISVLSVSVPGGDKVDLAGLLAVAYGTTSKLSEQEERVIRSILAVMVMVVGSSRVLSRTMDELSYYSTHDPLTGLYNRRYFNDMLEYEIGRSGRHRHEFSVLMLDLDDFKDVNDTYGHPSGDAVLKAIAEVMRSHMRVGDLATRIGGDEFAIILTETGKEGAMAAAEKLRHELRDIRFVAPNGMNYHVTASIGLVTFPHDAANIHDLMAGADAGLYRAKGMGKDGVGVMDAGADRLKAGRDVRSRAEELRAALNDGRIIPYFQPIFDCRSGALFAYEALARIKEPNGEIISAAAFIETIEKYGMGRDLDRPIIEKSLLAMQARMAQQPGIPARLFINLSAQEIQGRGILGYAEQICSELAIPPANVVFEILEREAISDMTHMRKFLSSLGEKGFSFALDDFGSGYNSFHYLRELHFDFVKIDGAFVRNILNSKMDYALVHNLSNLCQDIGTRTVAEFVESEEILDALRDMGINYVQGYHLGLPLPGMK
jgi:diguanylate cyclase (GGDEF)-like protein/PAS domain S-box-containing protein